MKPAYSKFHRGQEEFIRECFVRVCRVYYNVSLVKKVSWTADDICRVRVTGLRQELLLEFEQRVTREFDSTGYSLLGCTACTDQEPPCYVFDVHSRLSSITAVL